MDDEDQEEGVGTDIPQAGNVTASTTKKKVIPLKKKV
jgi:hypothetical protein